MASLYFAEYRWQARQMVRFSLQSLAADLRQACRIVGPRHVINATREVILSAGSINSPQVLLLSGIGPQEQLSALHIESIVDIPDVGSNLQDHALLPNPFNVNSTHTVDALARNATLADGLIDQWEANRTGLFTDGPGNLIGWLRLPSNASIFESAKDPSAGMRSGHFQFLFLVSGRPAKDTVCELTVDFRTISSRIRKRRLRLGSS